MKVDDVEVVRLPPDFVHHRQMRRQFGFEGMWIEPDRLISHRNKRSPSSSPPRLRTGRHHGRGRSAHQSDARQSSRCPRRSAAAPPHGAGQPAQSSLYILLKRSDAALAWHAAEASILNKLLRKHSVDRVSRTVNDVCCPVSGLAALTTSHKTSHSPRQAHRKSSGCPLYQKVPSDGFGQQARNIPMRSPEVPGSGYFRPVFEAIPCAKRTLGTSMLRIGVTNPSTIRVIRHCDRHVSEQACACMHGSRLRCPSPSRSECPCRSSEE